MYAYYTLVRQFLPARRRPAAGPGAALGGARPVRAKILSGTVPRTPASGAGPSVPCSRFESKRERGQSPPRQGLSGAGEEAPERAPNSTEAVAARLAAS